MKYICSLLIVISVTVIACHRKAAPVVNKAEVNKPVASEPVITERTVQPPPPPKPAEPTFASPDIASGKIIYTTTCIKCHNAKPVQNWNVEEWKPILKSMIPKAKLDFAGAAQLTAYVNAFARKD